SHASGGRAGLAFRRRGRVHRLALGRGLSRRGTDERQDEHREQDQSGRPHGLLLVTKDEQGRTAQTLSHTTGPRGKRKSSPEPFGLHGFPGDAHIIALTERWLCSSGRRRGHAWPSSWEATGSRCSAPS